jgi:predicted nucleic acid-binding Zn ribbon protein
MFGKKKVYVVHESRKSYEKRRNSNIAMGILAIVALIYLIVSYPTIFFIVLGVGLVIGLLWKLFAKKSKND